MCSKNAVHVCNVCVSYSLLPLFNRLLAGLVDLRVDFHAGAAISFVALRVWLASFNLLFILLSLFRPLAGRTRLNKLSRKRPSDMSRLETPEPAEKSSQVIIHGY